MPTTRSYRVDGMTCEHCVHAVTTEVGAIAGVSDVAVDLPAGTVIVTSAGALPDDAVAAAVDEAGYTLVS